ncbi:hypothetical protein BGZ94_009228, partial [Podila epigama]
MSSIPSAILIPVLITPPAKTKQIKVALDTAGWHDKSKLIARLGQLQNLSGTMDTTAVDSTGSAACKTDLSSHMAMALLPDTFPFGSSSTAEASQPISLWDYLHHQGEGQPLSTATTSWPALLQDSELQHLVYLSWMDPSLFATPRHLLVQTPHKKLRDSLTSFLTPILKNSTSNLTIDLLPALLDSIPQKWEHYSDFTLLPPMAFLAEPWPRVLGRLYELDHQKQQQQLGQPTDKEPLLLEQLETLVQAALGSTHIARKAIIPVQDILRRPKIRPLTGDWGIHNRFKSWIEHNDIGLLDHDTIQHQISRQDEGQNTHHSRYDPPSSSPIDASSDFDTNPDTTPTSETFKSAYWAMTCQNQVWYSWAPMFTMFSAGNITEKERVAHSRPIFGARDKVVVDLYAGIGYFTLVYLLHAGARTVHACEWNPWSVEGLARGADRNGIQWSKVTTTPFTVNNEEQEQERERVETQSDNQGTLLQTSKVSSSSSTKKKQSSKSKSKTNTATTSTPTTPLGNLVIYPGDNAQWISHFENTAHHVNLGLIPSAEPGWVLGVRALCPREGGYLHVHHNIRVGQEDNFKTYLTNTLQTLFSTWKKGQT